MKESKYLQIRVIESKSPDEFQNEFNAVQIELASKSPESRFEIGSDSYRAIIQYQETRLIPETALDELEVKGLTFVCADCPRFNPERNNDGSVRGSSKKGSCLFEPYGRRDASVCEWFAKAYLKGEIDVEVK